MGNFRWFLVVWVAKLAGLGRVLLVSIFSPLFFVAKPPQPSSPAIRKTRWAILRASSHCKRVLYHLGASAGHRSIHKVRRGNLSGGKTSWVLGSAGPKVYRLKSPRLHLVSTFFTQFFLFIFKLTNFFLFPTFLTLQERQKDKNKKRAVINV